MQQSLDNPNKLPTDAPHAGSFAKGIQAGSVVALGYVPIAITFGLVAKASGLPDYAAIMMSLFVFAGASQFVGVNLLALGVTHWEIIMTTFILNLRHFLMTASLSQRLPAKTPRRWLALLAFGVTDETFTVASLRPEKQLSPKFVLGLNLVAFSAWNAGTWIGLFVAAELPSSLQSSMGIALYAMFIGLLVPSLKKSKPVLMISLIAIGISAALYWIPIFKSLSAGWIIIIATLLASAIGAITFPKDDEA
jgi:4-azaleucine resistance transporter AzlC